MLWLESTRARLLVAGLLTTAALLLFTASLVIMRSRGVATSVAVSPTRGGVAAVGAPSRTAGMPAAPPTGTPVFTASPVPARSPVQTVTRPSTPAATPGGGATASPVVPGSPVAGTSPLPEFTTAQLVADYNLVWNALALIDPAAGLYAVAIYYEPGGVSTRFEFVSADKQWLFGYRVEGQPRAAVAQPGGPEAITDDARFEPFSTLPWERDPDWPTYVSRALDTLLGKGLTSLASVTRATLIARTGIAIDWDLAVEAPSQRFHFTITGGYLSQQTNVDPAPSHSRIRLMKPADGPSGVAGKWERERWPAVLTTRIEPATGNYRI